MEKDSYKTKVIFRKFKDDEVIALFPEMLGDNDLTTMGSYMHMGQHGSASMYIINDTKPANDIEYRSLMRELENNCGYNLQIIKRQRYSHYITRQNELSYRFKQY